MASSQEFVNYVMEQMALAGAMRARKMFGDYGFYCDDQFIGLICDNQCFLKVTEEGEAYLKTPQYGIPYEGAKPALLIENLEDRDFLRDLVQATCQGLARKGKKTESPKASKTTTPKEKTINQEGPLTDLPNIGKAVAKQLEQIGITTISQLQETGSREAWLRLLAIDDSACYNRLCALEGAIQGIRWHQLSPEDKASLKAFYETHRHE